VRKYKRALTGSGLERLGSTEHDTTSLDSIETLNDYGDYGPREHVLDEAGEEGLASEVLVVYKDRALSVKIAGVLNVRDTVWVIQGWVWTRWRSGGRTYAFRGVPWKE